MNKLFIALAMAASCAFAHAAPPADCAADISRQIQEDKDVAVNVRPNAKLCLTMNEPIVAVEYRNGDTPLRWQTNQDAGRPTKTVVTPSLCARLKMPTPCDGKAISKMAEPFFES